MIVKSGSSLDGRQVVLVGLTRENVQELVASGCLALARDTHGDGVPANLDIGLFFAETANDLARALAPYLGETGGKAKAVKAP
jgi:hypothetical protein